MGAAVASWQRANHGVAYVDIGLSSPSAYLNPVLLMFDVRGVYASYASFLPHAPWQAMYRAWTNRSPDVTSQELGFHCAKLLMHQPRHFLAVRSQVMAHAPFENRSSTIHEPGAVGIE